MKLLNAVVYTVAAVVSIVILLIPLGFYSFLVGKDMVGYYMESLEKMFLSE